MNKYDENLLAAAMEENARLTKAFEEVCEERDHWHSRALISEQASQPQVPEENVRLRQALQNMIDMAEGRFAADHPYTLTNAKNAIK